MSGSDPRAANPECADRAASPGDIAGESGVAEGEGCQAGNSGRSIAEVERERRCAEAIEFAGGGW